MEDYLSEREQIEKVRNVVKENAPWAIAGLVIGVGLIVGYQQYQAWQGRQAVAASQKYSTALEALSRGDADAATRLVTELGTGYARTPYADLAALALARFEVETAKYADAGRRLTAVMQESKDQELRLVARLRLARVQRAEGKPDAALATLAAAPAGSAGPAYAEVRGDAYADKGDKAAAIAAWREALAAKAPALANRELIELKIAALGGMPQADKAATSAAPPAAGLKP